MSTMQTLDDKLNQKADAEFDKISREITEKIFSPKESFGIYETLSYKNKNGVTYSFWDVGSFAREAIEVYREPFRSKFKSEFIAKVDAMQQQMESYIGELDIRQHTEGGQ